MAIQQSQSSYHLHQIVFCTSCKSPHILAYLYSWSCLVSILEPFAYLATILSMQKTCIYLKYLQELAHVQILIFKYFFSVSIFVTCLIPVYWEESLPEPDSMLYLASKADVLNSWSFILWLCFVCCIMLVVLLVPFIYFCHYLLTLHLHFKQDALMANQERLEQIAPSAG